MATDARPTSAPPAPAVNGVTATTAGVTWGLPWDVSGGAIDGSWLQVGLQDFGALIWDEQRTGWAGQTLVGLQPNTAYYVRAAAHNASGYSPWSPVASFRTAAYAVDRLAVVIEAGTAEATWAAPTGAPAPKGYELQASDDPNFAYVVSLDGPWALSRVVPDLAPGRRFYFRVRADSGSGWGAWSNVAEAVTPSVATLPEPAPREPGSAWSFIAQRATTGEFLDWDIPLTLNGLEWELSSPGSLKATLEPDVGGLRASDGRLVLEEWGTLIYAESGGEIRWGGIVVSCVFKDDAWELECAGFSTYPHRRTYQGEFSQIAVDPFVAFRHIWSHLQSKPDGNLGVVVSGTPTPVLLGKAAWTETTTKEDGTPDVKEHPAEPYTLTWYDLPNCGTELDNIAKQAPFDWVEKHRWSEDGERVLHQIEVAYPRAGRRRDDLVFVQGDNITDAVVVESNGDEYANTVIGVGAGEGRAMLRREAADRDGRLLVDTVYSDKAVTDPALLDTLIAEELSARRAALRIDSFVTTDHPNAPLGSWQLGDDVLVRIDVPWLGEVELWCRVIGWSLTGEATATIRVERSDHYRYGAPE